VFDWASVDTRQPITDDPKAEVLVKLHESKRNSIAYGFGFQVINRGGSIPSGTIALPGLPPIGLPTKFATSQQTFWGPEGSIEYTRRNFRGRAETLTLSRSADVLTSEQPLAWRTPRFWNTGWSFYHHVLPLNEQAKIRFLPRVWAERESSFNTTLDKNRQKSVIFRYDFRRTNLSNITIPDLVRPEDQNVRLSSLSASFSRDFTRQPAGRAQGNL